MCTATSLSAGRAAIPANSRCASSAGTPNLLILRPVEMCGWLPASMSGLTRIATRATTPAARASASTRSSSPADSTLIALRPERHGAGQLGVGLADAREHDVGRREARLAREVDLPDRIRVRSGAQLAQQPRERERRVGLERVVHAVGILAEARDDVAVALAEERRAVDVERRAFGGGDRRQRDAVADELLRGLGEADHSGVSGYTNPLSASCLPISPPELPTPPTAPCRTLTR